MILEVGTNDLALNPPEVVGSDIEELVRSIISDYSTHAVVLCQVTPRATDQNYDFNSVHPSGDGAHRTSHLLDAQRTY